MNLNNLIKTKIKEDDVIIGYKRVIKSIKTSHPRMIIYANNLPTEKIKVIKHNAKIGKIEVKEYPKDSLNLGLVCGKPFTVGVIAVKGSKK